MTKPQDVEQLKSHLKQFLASNKGEVAQPLRDKVIAQFGDEDYFLENYPAISMGDVSGSIGKFKKKVDTVTFFNENFDAIQASLMTMAQNYGVDSGIVLLIDNDCMKKKLKINSDDVAQSFFAPLNSIDDSTEKRVKVCHWVSQVILIGVCRDFYDFLERVDLW